eukprot:285201_1
MNHEEAKKIATELVTRFKCDPQNAQKFLNEFEKRFQPNAFHNKEQQYSWWTAFADAVAPHFTDNNNNNNNNNNNCNASNLNSLNINVNNINQLKEISQILQQNGIKDINITYNNNNFQTIGTLHVKEQIVKEQKCDTQINTTQINQNNNIQINNQNNTNCNITYYGGNLFVNSLKILCLHYQKKSTFTVTWKSKNCVSGIENAVRKHFKHEFHHYDKGGNNVIYCEPCYSDPQINVE